MASQKSSRGLYRPSRRKPHHPPNVRVRAFSLFFFHRAYAKTNGTLAVLETRRSGLLPGHGTPRRRRARRCRNEPGHRRLRGERPPHRSRSRAQGHRRQNVLGKPSQAVFPPQGSLGTAAEATPWSLQRLGLGEATAGLDRRRSPSSSRSKRRARIGAREQKHFGEHDLQEERLFALLEGWRGRSQEGGIGGRRPSLHRRQRPVQSHQRPDLLRGPEPPKVET